MDRYFLDIRVGCAAVRDRQHPSYNETYPGLHPSMSDVILYKSGAWVIDSWVISEEDIEELKLTCDKLNIYPYRDNKLSELGI
jgi:hypothetical protein